MVEAVYVPAEYQFKQSDEATIFSARAYPVKTTLCLGTSQNGWRLVKYDANGQPVENDPDVRESLDALKQPAGISLEDFKRELGI